MLACLEYDKPSFVSAFAELLKSTNTYSNLYRLDYVKCGEVEWLYITFNNLTQKRMNISGESCVGIMREFLQKSEKADNISHDSYYRKSEFLPKVE